MSKDKTKEALQVLRNAIEELAERAENAVVIYTVTVKEFPHTILSTTRDDVVQEFLNNKEEMEDWVTSDLYKPIEIASWTVEGEHLGDVTSDFDTTVFEQLCKEFVKDIEKDTLEHGE